MRLPHLHAYLEGEKCLLKEIGLSFLRGCPTNVLFYPLSSHPHAALERDKMFLERDWLFPLPIVIVLRLPPYECVLKNKKILLKE